MRIAFMGTPEFAVPSLDALVAAGHDVVAAYSQPPRPANRGKKLTPSPVQRRAEELGIAVRTPNSLRSSAAQAAFAALDLDVAVVAAYGLILPPAILEAPIYGCLNVHGSILPRWRGAAPVQHAILAADAETGVTIMQMDEGLDTGAIRLIERTPVLTKTAGELTAEIANIGANAMVRVLADIEAFPPRAQPIEGATYAAKIAKDEARLDFVFHAAELVRMVRAFNPAPGAWFIHEGERLRVHAAEAEPQPCHPREGGDPVPLSVYREPTELDSRLRGNDMPGESIAPGTVIDDRLGIATGCGIFRPTSIQRAGRPRMPIDAFLRGFDLPSGTRLG